MAVYKVPQDVEADDKLIGPFSFRQFLYLIIVAAAIALAWGLSRVFLPLALIPLPAILLFGALALPLRKDQPMEVYLAAVVSFHLKPRKRMWQPDGITSLVQVIAPKNAEVQRTKSFDQAEAEKRLSYLANIVDSRGWSVRGVDGASANTAMNSDVYYAAQQTEDVLDGGNPLSKNFDNMISQADANRRKEMIDRMHQPQTSPITSINQPQSTPLSPASNPAPDTLDEAAAAELLSQVKPHYNPYPENIHQTVLMPLSQQPQTQPSVAASTAPQPVAQTPPQSQPATPVVQQSPQPQPAPTSASNNSVSPDIIDLANNHHDLSIETLQREANRIREKSEHDNEVVISLR